MSQIPTLSDKFYRTTLLLAFTGVGLSASPPSWAVDQPSVEELKAEIARLKKALDAKTPQTEQESAEERSAETPSNEAQTPETQTAETTS